jgi:cytidylate kinase
MNTNQSQESSILQHIEVQVKKWELNKKEKYKKRIHPVITLSRLPGCGAHALAKQLSEDLDMDLFDHEIVEAVAKSAHVSESVIATLDEQERTMLDEWIRILDEKHHLWSDEYLPHLAKVISAIAAHGHAIIVGRGSGYLLPNDICLRLLIVAPMDFRIHNVMNTYGVTAEVARNQITKTETDRRAFVKQYFQADLTDPVNYDLTLNIAQYAVKEAAKIVKEAFNSRSWYDYSVRKL